jgi:broad specificity phosphatase PhoE
VVLVAHGHILRALGARWVGEPVGAGRALALGTAAVCRLGWERNDRVLQLWNYTAGGV